MSYRYEPPLDDMRFVIEHVLDAPSHWQRCTPWRDLDMGTVSAVVEEAGRFASGVLQPLNAVGDREGCRRDEQGRVRTPTGFREAYRAFVDGGWPALTGDPDWGGQGLPLLVDAAMREMLSACNHGWTMYPDLLHGAVETVQAHAGDALKERYLRQLVSGEWLAAMALTEPQAGSDLGVLRTRAVPQADGSVRITGQKIFISGGDHDLTDNIVHMVLARIPGGPPGSRGISLFLVPKFLPDAEGKPGERNDLRPLRLEEKLGIHASPTCVMSYGDDGGAIGWRIGEENRGLECMFTMMNSERLLVGVQGVAIAERAYQQALDYARARVQGQPAGVPRGAGPVPIVHHPDVRRMLLSMRAGAEAMRALTYLAGAAIDASRAAGDDKARFRAQRRADLLIPVVKAWFTDLGVEIASTGVQVHGGMGYIEETGAAQYYRDACIAPIYEGTNGIQANDLVGRKLGRDKGEAARELFAEMRPLLSELGGAAKWEPLHRGLAEGLDALERATAHLVEADPAIAAAGSAPYLALFGTVVGGWLMARLALAAREHGDAGFTAAKFGTARFYAEHYLPRAPAYLPAILGGATIVDFDPDLL